MQAQLWILNLVAPHFIKQQPLLERDESHYRLHHPEGNRITYGIDHESYVYQLGLDMDSAMGFGEVVGRGLFGGVKGGWKIPLVWALGANYNTKFRLRGPWRWVDGAEEVMTGEFWGVIMRRRWFWGEFLVLLLLVLCPFGISVLCDDVGCGLCC